MLEKPAFLKGTVAVIASAGANTYYHWILDILPRILFLKEANLFESIDRFIINHHNLPFQQQALSLLGIDEEKIVRCYNNRDFHIEAENLIVPVLPSHLNEVNGYECTLLKKYLLPERKSVVNKRIYLTRRLTNTRVIVNEGNLICRHDPSFNAMATTHVQTRSAQLTNAEQK